MAYLQGRIVTWSWYLPGNKIFVPGLAWIELFPSIGVLGSTWDVPGSIYSSSSTSNYSLWLAVTDWMIKNPSYQTWIGTYIGFWAWYEFLGWIVMDAFWTGGKTDMDVIPSSQCLESLSLFSLDLRNIPWPAVWENESEWSVKKTYRQP